MNLNQLKIKFRTGSTKTQRLCGSAWRGDRLWLNWSNALYNKSNNRISRYAGVCVSTTGFRLFVCSDLFNLVDY